MLSSFLNQWKADIPGFVGSGNGLIGWGSKENDLLESNGGFTPALNPGNKSLSQRFSREAFGFLKLVLINYHAGLRAADNIVEKKVRIWETCVL